MCNPLFDHQLPNKFSKLKLPHFLSAISKWILQKRYCKTTSWMQANEVKHIDGTNWLLTPKRRSNHHLNTEVRSIKFKPNQSNENTTKYNSKYLQIKHTKEDLTHVLIPIWICNMKICSIISIFKAQKGQSLSVTNCARQMTYIKLHTTTISNHTDRGGGTSKHPKIPAGHLVTKTCTLSFRQFQCS